MKTITVKTQDRLDRALKNRKPDEVIVCSGGTREHPLVVRDSSSVEARDSSRVEALDSSSVEAWDSSRVEAWGASSVVAWDSSRVVAWGASSVLAWDASRVVAWGASRVVARDSSRVVARDSSRVVARGSSSVVARDSSSVEAGQYVSVHKHGISPKIRGGVVICVPHAAELTAEGWCAFYGVPVKRGMAVLFKAVDDDWATGPARAAGISYAPGSKPKAQDWNGRPECGGGLHVSPHPTLARDYNRDATRFVACPVRVAEAVVVGDKLKVPRIAGKTYEVDLFGDRLEGGS